MLPKSSRLNLKKDFKWAVLGKTLDTKYVKLFVRVGENNSPKLGIATPIKTFKKSFERNRARRLTSAAFESLYSLLPLHLNILALPKAPILGVKSGDVLLDLEASLKDAKIID